MFRPRPDAPAATIAVEVEGQAVTVPPGASAAAALLLAGLATIRETPISGSGRAPYCMMGICFDCLAAQCCNGRVEAERLIDDRSRHS